MYRGGHPEMFLENGVLYLFSKCRGVIARWLYWNRISAWVSTVTLLHIFRAPFVGSASWWLLLWCGQSRRGLRYLFLCNFWLLWPGTYFWGGTISSAGLEIFLIFLMFLILRCSATCEATYAHSLVYDTRIQVPFYLWRIKPILKCCIALSYYFYYCMYHGAFFSSFF